MRKALSCALLAVFTAFPCLARAQHTVLVLGLDTRDDDRELHGPSAARLTAALRDVIAGVPGWRVHGETPELREAATAHGCTYYDPDEDCVAALGRAYGASYVLYGRLTLSGMSESRRYAVALDVIDTRNGSRYGDTMRTVVVDDEDAVLAIRVRELLDDVNIRPIAAARRAESGNRDLFIGLGIGSYVIGAVWLVATIASAVRIGDIQSDPSYATYRERVPPGTTNVCDEAAAGNGWVYDEMAILQLCSEAATLEVLQWVFLSAAAAFAGLGTAFLLFEPGVERPPVTVTPSVSADRATFTVTARF